MKRPPSLQPKISEALFTQQVIDLARWHKWRVAHFRSAMTKRGRWVTPVSGDGAGFPDLVLVRGNCLIFAELKSTGGRVSTEQEKWILALRGASAMTYGAVMAYVWRPNQIDEIEGILK